MLPALWAGACALGLALPAAAQLRLPGGVGAAVPALPGPTELSGALRRSEPALDAPSLQELRQRANQALLRRHADRVEADPAGEPVLRGELLLWSPPAALLDAARALGFTLLREQAIDGLDERLVVLAPPPGLGTAQALARLREQAPGLGIDFNHLYAPGGALDGVPPRGPPPTTDLGAPAAPTATRVGLIDGGVDARHPALQAGELQRWGCDGAAVASAHGTAVASLLVGRAPHFASAAPGARLYAADVYCGQPVGGSAESIAQALGWLARERVGVIAISLVGPANRLLERAVARMVERGHLLVAAVGNDGPAAPPLYPAAWPGVVGVTAVDVARRILPEAARGEQVMFAAPGAELAVAVAGQAGYTSARGTSFAAPLVAGLLAAGLPQPDRAAAALRLEAQAAAALDLGAPGRDPVYGYGLVGEALRTEPRLVRAAGRLAR